MAGMKESLKGRVMGRQMGLRHDAQSPHSPDFMAAMGESEGNEAGMREEVAKVKMVTSKEVGYRGRRRRRKGVDRVRRGMREDSRGRRKVKKVKELR